MRVQSVISLILVAIVDPAKADAMSSFGSVTSMATAFLPPELRGIGGAVANAALATANKKKGLIEFIQDGSDYGWICLCPTTDQIAAIKKSTGQTLAANQCGEDFTMGCKPAQIDMAAAPMITPPTPAPKSSR